MTKSKLYTGTGDLGTTSLVGGSRVSKTCVRLEAYGTVDEFSSFLGVVLSHSDCPASVRGDLLRIQDMMFNLGGYLASEVPAGEQPAAWNLCEDDVEWIEGRIDRLDTATPKVNAFVLPGGTLLAAHTHVARTVCRRAERRILQLAALEWVDPMAIRFMNRLSDYLFILARHFNHAAGVCEITWQLKRAADEPT